MMTFKNLLLTSVCLVGTQAVSDTIAVSTVYARGTFEEPFPADVRLFQNGREMTTIARTKLDSDTYEFALASCEDGMVFRATAESQIVTFKEEFYPCEAPEMTIVASLSNFQTASASSPFWIANDAPPTNAPLVAYAEWIQDAIDIDATTLAAMGPTAAENQTRMIVALASNELGVAAFYANENAAIARLSDFETVSIGYSALSYDTGFRAMGINPAGTTIPLVGLDPSQNNIPVPTPEGLGVLRQYNLEIVDAQESDIWSFDTTSSLRAGTRPVGDPLLEINSADQLLRLEFDPSGGIRISN